GVGPPLPPQSWGGDEDRGSASPPPRNRGGRGGGRAPVAEDEGGASARHDVGQGGIVAQAGDVVHGGRARGQGRLGDRGLARIDGDGHRQTAGDAHHGGLDTRALLGGGHPGRARSG